MKTVLNRQFIILSLTSFFFVTANHCYDLLPKHFALNSFTSSETGFIMSFTGVGGVLVLPLLIYIIDKYNKKLILRFVLVSHALIPLLYFAGFPSNAWYSLPRLLQGSMAAAMMISLTTSLSYVIPEEHRSKGYAFFGVTGQVGLILSMAFGELIYDTFGFFVLYLFSAVIFIIPILFIHNLSSFTETDKRRAPHFSDFFDVLSQKKVYPVIYWVFIHGAVYGTFLSFMPNVVLNAGLDYVRPFYIGFSVVVAIVRLTLGKHFDSFKRTTILFVPLFILPLSLFMMPLVDSYVLLSLTGMVYGFCNGVMFPLLTASLIDFSPYHFRGRMTVLFQLFFNLGIFLASNIGGKIAEISASMTFIVMGVFAATGVGLLIITIKTRLFAE